MCLYAASNFGSLVALLSYPFVLEPVFGLRTLASIWTAGFVLLLVALGVCFWIMRRETGSENTLGPRAAEIEETRAPDTRARASWVFLAFVPSAMLTAFTTHVATDIASAPLIWVLPLSLYLADVRHRARANAPDPAAPASRASSGGRARRASTTLPRPRRYMVLSAAAAAWLRSSPPRSSLTGRSTISAPRHATSPEFCCVDGRSGAYWGRQCSRR